MKKQRTVAVVTGTRAEYGLLTPVMKLIRTSPLLRLRLVVTGMHLMAQHGHTIQEIRKDGFLIDKTVPMYFHGLERSILAQSFGIGTLGLGRAFEELDPSIVLVLGDRLEPLAAAIAAATMNIAVAHVHGGEKSESGHIDELTRHAISRFAHLHFTATAGSARRLELFGEQPWRIHQVGAPGLDTIQNLPLKDKRTICRQLQLDPEERLILCVQHSVLVERNRARHQMRETMKALKRLGLQTVVIYPNADPGGEEIIEVIEEYRQYPHLHIFPNLDHISFLSLMKSCDVMIGNSSASIIEAPSFHVPVVHIGTRNKGREHAGNVLFVPHRKEEVVKAIRATLHDEAFRRKVRECRNPYGDGKASQRIVHALESVALDERLMRKEIAY